MCMAHRLETEDAFVGFYPRGMAKEHEAANPCNRCNNLTELGHCTANVAQ